MTQLLRLLWTPDVRFGSRVGHSGLFAGVGVSVHTSPGCSIVCLEILVMIDRLGWRMMVIVAWFTVVGGWTLERSEVARIFTTFNALHLSSFIHVSILLSSCLCRSIFIPPTSGLVYSYSPPPTVSTI